MKFKEGDLVVCIDPPGEPVSHEEDSEYRGSGWELGYEFVVTLITNKDSSCPIYWNGIKNCGVYGRALSLKPNSWKERYQ